MRAFLFFLVFASGLVSCNELLKSCNEPSCSAFANVSLVLGVTAAERIPYLLDYSLWFANLHFMLSNEECAECRCQILKLPPAHLRKTAFDCRHGFNTSSDHAAATRGMQHAAMAAKILLGWPVRGVLFAHMDMWINVRKFQHAPFDFVWSPLNGLLTSPDGAPACYTRGNMFRRRVPRYVVAQTRQCHAAAEVLLPILNRTGPDGTLRAGVLALPLETCCFGWSDMYYVPQFALDAFAELSNALSSEFLEVAIPTIARVLQQEANVSWWKTPCTGNCCQQIRDPPSIRPSATSQLCGHKLALDKPQYRALLTRTVHPQAPSSLVDKLLRQDAARWTSEMKANNQSYVYGYSMYRNTSLIRHCGSQEDADDPWTPAWVMANAISRRDASMKVAQKLLSYSLGRGATTGDAFSPRSDGGRGKGQGKGKGEGGSGGRRNGAYM